MNYTEEQIREKLATDEKWVRRALVRLLERQTQFEKTAQTTAVNNAKGFQPCDAKWFTRIAQFVTKYPNNVLSEKQLKIVRRPWRGQPAICKYAGQLLQVMKEDAMAVQAKSDLQWKLAFAKQEAAQEAAAFMSDPDLFPHHVDFGSAA